MTRRSELSVLFLILINVTLNTALTYVTVGTNFQLISFRLHIYIRIE